MFRGCARPLLGVAGPRLATAASIFSIESSGNSDKAGDLPFRFHCARGDASGFRSFDLADEIGSRVYHHVPRKALASLSALVGEQKCQTLKKRKAEHVFVFAYKTLVKAQTACRRDSLGVSEEIQP